MTAFGIVIVTVLTLLLAALIINEIVAPAIAKWLRRRQVVRRSALESQLQAMNAAQQLSFMTWQARHQMYNLGNEMHHPESSHPSRTTLTHHK